MLLIAVSYKRCGRNLRAKLDTVIHAYLKTLYCHIHKSTVVQLLMTYHVHHKLVSLATHCALSTDIGYTISSSVNLVVKGRR